MKKNLRENPFGYEVVLEKNCKDDVCEWICRYNTDDNEFILNTIYDMNCDTVDMRFSYDIEGNEMGIVLQTLVNEMNYRIGDYFYDDYDFDLGVFTLSEHHVDGYYPLQYECRIEDFEGISNMFLKYIEQYWVCFKFFVENDYPGLTEDQFDEVVKSYLIN